MFLAFFFLFALFERCASFQELYVTAHLSSSECPDDDYVVCETLSFYLERKDEYFIDNTTFYFMSGIHIMPNELIVFDGVNGIEIQGLGDIIYEESSGVAQSTSVLECTTANNGGILFSSCDNILISQITITNCSALYLIGPSGDEGNASLTIYDSGIVNIESLSIQNSKHNGLLIINTTDISITSSSFFRNGLDNNSWNVVIYYPVIYNSSLASDRCIFIHSTNISSSGFGGLLLLLKQQRYYVYAHIESSKLSHNVHNVFVYSAGACRYSVSANDILCSHSLQSGFDVKHSNSLCSIETYARFITVSNSSFISNSYVAFSVSWFSHDYGYISISSTNFTDNVGALRSALSIEQISRSGTQKTFSGLEVNLNSLRFERNTISIEETLRLGYTAEYQFTIIVINTYNMIIHNSTFIDNVGSAVALYSSFVTFAGENLFRNNSAIFGGALSMANNAYIFLKETTKMIFIGNSALKGGAVFVIQYLPRIFEQEGNRGLYANCFYQTVEPIINSPKGLREIFVFQDNTASIAGSTVYSTITDNCLSFSSMMNVGTNLFVNMSKFVNQSSDSTISSDPVGVCFCINGTKDCSVNSIQSSAFPGSLINISIVAVGNKNGNTPAFITITNSSFYTLKRILIPPICTNLSYTHHIKNDSIINDITYIFAYTDSVVSNELDVHVSILPCPNGYELSYLTGICECNKQVSYLAECFPSLQFVERSNSVWVGYSSQLNCTLANSNCPFDYCNFDPINVSLTNPNSQCALNRGYQLCGRCISDNYSLVLGSNACKYCNNNAALLIVIPIGIAGIALIGLILLLNLTVAVGTINGLIFFANIVKIYEPLFSIKLIPFLSQFISMLNLELGIETCFYNGMNALVKIGLQFAFPFYLWFIITGIIIISKYSLKFAKLTGNNTIPVLATVILLSYMKLLRTVRLILSISYLNCGQDTYLYWFVDPSQRYLHGWHILLFIMAIFVLVLFIIPFTLFLLLYPLLELSSEKCRRRLSWFSFKLKPFFDSYRAPYTNLFCFWPGVLLVVRIVLAFSVALNSEACIPLAILFAVLIFLISILSIGKVYNGKTTQLQI